MSHISNICQCLDLGSNSGVQILKNSSKIFAGPNEETSHLAYSIISNARMKDSWSTSWLNVENLFRYDRNVMTYKIMNRLCPESLWDKFQPRSFHSTYNTRHCRDLQIPRYRTEFAKKGFHYAALTLWNDTPAEIRDLPSLDRFKKQLKAHLRSWTLKHNSWKNSND